MKYFRIHPDLLIIANYSDGAFRIRHGRQTTPQQLSNILIHTIIKTLSSGKKILLLTDSPDAKKHKGFIIRTAWDAGKPQSILRLVSRLIYNHETHAVCVLFHPELFGRFWTSLIMPALILLLRLSGKKVMTVFLTTPKLSAQPTIVQTIRYFMRFGLNTILTAISGRTITGEKTLTHKLMRLTGKKTIVTIPMTFRSLKERHQAGHILGGQLFPSPTENLGLSHLLKKGSALS